MQLENLDYSPMVVEFKALLPARVAAFVERVSLRSITFLYEHPSETESCRLEKDRLVIAQGKLCSLRLKLTESPFKIEN